jgi:thioredoxin reductase (NADPH)
VTVIHRGSAFSRAQQVGVDRLRARSNVELLFDTELVEIGGSEKVSSVKLRTNGSLREQELAGVFVFVGLEPNTAFVRGAVDLDSTGHVIVDHHLQSSATGVYAAGDLRQGASGQLVSAAGDGATAAVSAARYLKGF